MVIVANFSGARQVKDGIASVSLGGLFAGEGQSAFIDKSGKFVRGPWDRLTSPDFVDGLIRDKVAGMWGYLDRNGNVKIVHRFIENHNFSEGLAGV